MFNIYPIGIAQSDAEDTALIPVDGTMSSIIGEDVIVTAITEDEITATVVCEGE